MKKSTYSGSFSRSADLIHKYFFRLCFFYKRIGAIFLILPGFFSYAEAASETNQATLVRTGITLLGLPAPIEGDTPAFETLFEQEKHSDFSFGEKATFDQRGNSFSGSLDPVHTVLDQGLNYGLGIANTTAETMFSNLLEGPYGGSRARFDFRADWNGKINGEGDVLLPLYDSPHTTIYSQLGMRSMNVDGGQNRWIGNVGLGQRWYPDAVGDGKTVDSGNWMLGYNVFFDYDFTRRHQRGSIGVEAQYDWLHLASNLYFPFSGWKNSKDFDGDFIKERAAKGWDVRLKGFVPFYRNVAITGSYSRWSGDHVGMFGPKHLERNPRVWSYGIEYTPVSLVSGYITQHATERGRTDTEIGLRLTYRFGVPGSEQLSHRKVAETRTVHASRHDFVDRENRIILEYKPKNDFYIEYLGPVSSNVFRFRVRDSFRKIAAGKIVLVSVSGGAVLAEGRAAQTRSARAEATGGAGRTSGNYTTDYNGEFVVPLKNVVAPAVTLRAQIGKSSQTVVLHCDIPVVTAGLAADARNIANDMSATLTLTSNLPDAVVSWSVSGSGTLSSEQRVTDKNGTALATLTAAATGAKPIVAKATINGQEHTVTVGIIKAYRLSFAEAPSVGAFSSGQATAALTVSVLQNGEPVPAGTSVVWSVVSADNTANAAVSRGYASKRTGLSWGASAVPVTSSNPPELIAATTSATDASGNARMRLTDIVGQRTISVQARVSLGNQDYSATQTLSFGAGPLAVFRLPGGSPLRDNWRGGISLCGGSQVSNIRGSTSSGYHAMTRLPDDRHLQAVAGGTGLGAALAAGWDTGGSHYWTGHILADGERLMNRFGHAHSISISDGRVETRTFLTNTSWAVCMR